MESLLAIEGNDCSYKLLNKNDEVRKLCRTGEVDNKEYLYSFIMYYRGGTYISQILSSDLKSALLLWATKLNIENIKYLGIRSKNELINKVQDEIPMHIDQMSNIWYVDFFINRNYMYAHIIKMQKEIDNEKVHVYSRI